MTEQPNILAFRTSHDGFLKTNVLNEMSQYVGGPRKVSCKYRNIGKLIKTSHRYSIVSIMTTSWVGQSGLRIPAGARDNSLFQSVHIRSWDTSSLLLNRCLDLLLCG